MNTFKALDKDGDGKLTKEELTDGLLIIFSLKLWKTAAYMKLYNNKSLAEEEVDKIIKQCDQNLSGNIDFTGIFIFLLWEIF